MIYALLAITNVYGAPVSLPDFVGLVETASPAVVNISTSQSIDLSSEADIDVPSLPEDHPFSDLFERFFNEEGMPPDTEQFDAASLGSGFVISADGSILTNYHVIRGAEEIVVKLSDRRQLPATVIGVDPASDLALLKVAADDLPVVKIGSSERLKVGEWVVAIGSPFGFDHSVTKGIVSAKGRSVGMERYVPFIQTDVAINPGNSGGPLFNLEGEVVGINSQIYSRTGGFMGVSFAIPIDLAMDVARQLAEYGKVSRGWLGVNIQDVTRDLAESFNMPKPEGALVRNVFPESPAAQSGLSVGDVILKFNGKSIYNADELPPLVGRSRAGSIVPVEINRDGESHVVDVTLGELPAPEQPVIAQSPHSRDDGQLGLHARNLNTEEQLRYQLKEGVVVDQVTGNPAKDAGIQNGDVIISIDQVRVKNVAHFEETIRGLSKGKPFAVLIRRQGASIFLPLRISR